MRLIWVTGVSGAGKSTLCDVLKSRGIAAVDTDWDGFNCWAHRHLGDLVVDPPHPQTARLVGHVRTAHSRGS